MTNVKLPTRRDFLKHGILGGVAMLAKNAAAVDGLPPIQNRRAKHADVIVIGAGIAGLAAAIYMQHKNATVRVLEARNRIGGRIWTDRTLGFPVDLGATWIHGARGNPLVTLARKVKAPTIATNYSNLAVYDQTGTELNSNDVTGIQTTFNGYFQKVLNLQGTLGRDTSLDDGFQRVLRNVTLTDVQQQQLHWQQAVNIVGATGAELIDTSLLSYDQAGVYKGGDVLLSGGYDQILGRLTTGVNIELNQIVQSISYNDSNSFTATVSTNQGDFIANAVLVTLPLGVLKSGAVQFKPALPADKLNSISRMGMGVLNRIVLQFDAPFWPVDKDFVDYISPNFNEFPQFLNLYKYTKQPMLCALTAGNFAQAVEALSDDDTVSYMTNILRTMFGASVPAPTGSLVTRWGSDPYSFGSNSYLPVTANFNDYKVLSNPVSIVLFFAGEATNDTFPNTVHGAYLSGIREAKRIIKVLAAL